MARSEPTTADSGRSDPTLSESATADSATSVGLPGSDAVGLWLIAVLWFGVGDVATTGLGLRVDGVVELHPLATPYFRQSVLVSMIALKGAAFACCVVLWRLAPRPHRLGVPIGLVVLGVLVTLWNLGVLLRALLA